MSDFCIDLLDDLYPVEFLSTPSFGSAVPLSMNPRCRDVWQVVLELTADSDVAQLQAGLGQKLCLGVHPQCFAGKVMDTTMKNKELRGS